MPAAASSIDPYFLDILTNIGINIILAVSLNRRIRFIGFYRTAIFVPFVASAAATGILSTYLFNPQFGLVNHVLSVLPLPQQLWLEDKAQSMVVIAIMSLWGQAAFTTVMFEIAKLVFSAYVTSFSPSSLYTGTVATIVVIVFWVYYAALIFILGGEVGQVYELRRTRKLQREVFLD